MKIRKLVLNERGKTLAICSLKAYNMCHLHSGFMAKQYISKELNFRFAEQENDKAFQGRVYIYWKSVSLCQNLASLVF